MYFEEYTRRVVQARQAHVCAECRGEIAADTTYVRNGQRLGVQITTVARHAECLAFADRFRDLLTTDQGLPLHLHAAIAAQPALIEAIGDLVEDEHRIVVTRLSERVAA
ncbi:MAG: hypothetical protein WBF53_05115 [Litorimonas sp.]